MSIVTTKTMKPILTESILVSADTKKHRFIGFDGALCVAGAKALGVSQVDAGSGEMMSVDVLGILLVETNEAISVGDPIKSAGSGADAGRAGKATDVAVSSAITSSVDTGATPVTSTAADGEVVTSTAVNTVIGGVLPEAINGYALDSASGAGEFIRIARLS